VLRCSGGCAPTVTIPSTPLSRGLEEAVNSLTASGGGGAGMISVLSQQPDGRATAVITILSLKSLRTVFALKQLGHEICDGAP